MAALAKHFRQTLRTREDFPPTWEDFGYGANQDEIDRLSTLLEWDVRSEIYFEDACPCCIERGSEFDLDHFTRRVYPDLYNVTYEDLLDKRWSDQWAEIEYFYYRDDYPDYESWERAFPELFTRDLDNEIS